MMFGINGGSPALLHRSIVTGACALGLAVFAPAATPFSFDAAPGRLPKDVRPLDYRIDIVPDIGAMSIAGRETVLLEFRIATATIRFNSLNQTLRDVRLDGRAARTVVTDDSQQLTTVTLAAPAAAGRHTLTFRFRGRIERQPHGLYLLPYRDARGSEAFILSTQMESTDARRMFPCWDEPAFRATFRLSTTQPADWVAISNMPQLQRSVHGKLATTTFARSPSMPAYLIEYTAGDLAGKVVSEAGVRLGAWAVRGQEKSAEAALANARMILGDYNDYFAYRYPLPKLDSIAIPGGWDGAMENWGAITYADNLLLFTTASTLQNQQETFSTQAHEMAHMWNGDLVTMAWWDDLWLNESFAEWMAFNETAACNPDWKFWELKDADRERAMSADARASSHAMQRPVNDELQASVAFDSDITYSKGAAVLHMLETYAGQQPFRDGIRAFMRTHAYSNATAGDLWKAIGGATGTDFRAIAAGWTERPGFPLVLVESLCDASGARSLQLSQRRFLLSGTDPLQQRWSVPLQIRVGVAGTPRSELLTADGQVVAAGRCDEPVSVNAGAVGYYRVAYDAATLDVDTRSFASLPDGDRIALLDDQWAMVETGMAPLSSYLALVATMGSSQDLRAWQQVLSALGTIEYAQRGAPGHRPFVAYAQSLLAPALATLGLESRPGETLAAQGLRRMLLQTLGLWGDEAVIAEMRRRFEQFAADQQSLLPDDRVMILAVVARHADAATFGRLHDLAVSAIDMADQQRDYAALALVSDAALAREVTRIALSDEMPPQAEFLRLNMIIALAGEHQQLSWESLSPNIDRLTALLTDSAQIFMAQTVPATYWSGLPLDELEKWVRAHVNEELTDDIDRGMETARFKLNEKASLVRQSDEILRGAAADHRP